MSTHDNHINVERAPKDRDNPYGMLRRATFDGSSLTFEERGVLAYILMKPDNWKANIKDLMREGSIGRDKTYAIINGLIAKGYAERVDTRDIKGHFQGVSIRIHEQPLPEKPETAQPYTALPETAQPYTENQEHNNKGSIPITDQQPIIDQKPITEEVLGASRPPTPQILKQDTLINVLATQVAKPITEQQEMFGAICEALGLDYHIIDKSTAGQVAKTSKVLRNAGYTVEDIRLFMREIWFKDWRWTKNQQYPTIKSLREGMGQLRSVVKDAAPKKELAGIEGFREVARRNGIHL